MATTRRDPEITPAEFFDGVAEMRAHLDRDSKQSGREQLTRMALDLTRPRSFDALCQWLCETIFKALAARGAALLLRTGARYAVHVTTGVLRCVPTNIADDTPGGSLLPLVGRGDAFGALWIEHDDAMDRSLQELMHAIVDAVAMSLESLHQRTALT